MSMETSFTELVPMLICNDVQKSIRFYVDILGFTVAGRMDDVGTSGWASLDKGRVKLMLASPSYLNAPQQNGNEPLTDTLYYFHTENVVSLKAYIESKGVEVSDFKVRFYEKKEIEILDPRWSIAYLRTGYRRTTYSRMIWST